MLQQEDEKTRRILVHYSRTVGIEPAMRAAPAVALRTSLESGRDNAFLHDKKQAGKVEDEALKQSMSH